jgi:hypothetical protein
LNSSPKPPHKKSQWSFSIRFVTQAVIGKIDKKYVRILEIVLFIKVTLPPLDKYIHFQLANNLSIFPTIDLILKEALNGRPRYFKGKKETP